MEVQFFTSAKIDFDQVQKDSHFGSVSSLVHCRVEGCSRELAIFLSPYCADIVYEGRADGIDPTTMQIPGLDGGDLFGAYNTWVEYLVEQYGELRKKESAEYSQRILPIGLRETYTFHMTFLALGDAVRSALMTLDPQAHHFACLVKQEYAAKFRREMPLSQKEMFEHVQFKKPSERDFGVPFKLKILEGIPRKIKERVSHSYISDYFKRGVVEGVLTYTGAAELSILGGGKVVVSNHAWDEMWIPTMDPDEYHTKMLGFKKVCMESQDPLASWVMYYGSHMGALRSFMWVLDEKDLIDFRRRKHTEDLSLLCSYLDRAWS